MSLPQKDTLIVVIAQKKLAVRNALRQRQRQRHGKARRHGKAVRRARGWLSARYSAQDLKHEIRSLEEKLKGLGALRLQDLERMRGLEHDLQGVIDESAQKETLIAVMIEIYYFKL